MYLCGWLLAFTAPESCWTDGLLVVPSLQPGGSSVLAQAGPWLQSAADWLVHCACKARVAESSVAESR